MEQVESIPFSSLVAGMLLLRRQYTSLEAVHILCKLEGNGIVVDEENDDFSKLFCCIEIGKDYYFQLKKGLQYDTILYQDITVFDFLKIHTNDIILSFLNDYFQQTNKNERDEYQNESYKKEQSKKKVNIHSKKRVLLKGNKSGELNQFKKPIRLFQ